MSKKKFVFLPFTIATLAIVFILGVSLTTSTSPVIFEAQTVSGCTPISVAPYTIASSGTYCLTRHIITAQSAISINADNVVLDFNGYSIMGSRHPMTVSIGIHASDRRNIHIKNGIITGFMYAIRISDSAYGQSIPYNSGYHVIEGMTISHSIFRGIGIQGDGNVIQNNIIRDIQGNQRYTNGYAMGIEATGLGALIQNNRIFDVRGYGTADIGEGVGISLSSDAEGSLVLGNTISNGGLEESAQSDFGLLSRSTWGIWLGGETGAIVSDNFILNYAYGIGLSETISPSVISNNTIMSAYLPISVSLFAGRDNIHVFSKNICSGVPCFDICVIGSCQLADYLPPR